MDWLGDIDDHTEFVAPRDGVTLIAVTSLDGRAAIDGASGGLGNPADAEILRSLRAASDVVLVGAGTVRAEGYGPAAPPTRLAVLSRTLDIDPESALFDDPANPPIIIGGADAEPGRREALARAGAELIDLPGTEPDRVLAALRRLGFRRIALEGGPGVYRDFLRADAVDRVFLTLSPVFVGDGPATFGSREEAGQEAEADAAHGGETSSLPATFRAEAAAFSDSHLFVRYSRGAAG